MFAYFTLGMYLVAGVVAIRVFAPEMTTVTVDTSYSKLFSKYEIKTVASDVIDAPVIAFETIKIDGPKQSRVKAVVAKKKPAPVEAESIHENILPFHEPVIVEAVILNQEIPQFASLYKEFTYSNIASVPTEEIKEDIVSTAQAADAEPAFFEYEEPVKEEKVVAATETASVETKEEIIADKDEEVSSGAVVTKDEEVAIDELISFDYSKAQQDLKQQTMPTVGKVTTQLGASAPAPVVQPSTVKWDRDQKNFGKKLTTQPTTTQKADALVDDVENKSLAQASLVEKPSKYYAHVKVGVTGTDLKSVSDEVGFEIRFQDDLSASLQDYNSGEIVIEETLAHPLMNRSIAVLKRGFAPTNVDLILEDGGSELKIPLIEESTYNEMLAPYESRGPLGSVLVELDEKTQTASLDVPYSQVVLLDERMRPVTGNSFAYQLFVGVKAGNALLSYKSETGVTTSRIIHIHEHELTFDANLSENVIHDRVEISEEDLLSKEKTPLVLSAEEVRIFATDKTSRKLNNNTYKLEQTSVNLGGRSYIELSHQSEPVFVGYREQNKLEIPSENFMRYILSKFENSKLGNRCLIQVNLSKKAVKFDVAAESVSSSLVTYNQILDADGKFYDSLGDKSEKVIVVGENQGAPELSQDGKVNFRIEYSDGTTEFLSSYCSPNTYLVEQL